MIYNTIAREPAMVLWPRKRVTNENIEFFKQLPGRKHVALIDDGDGSAADDMERGVATFHHDTLRSLIPLSSMFLIFAGRLSAESQVAFSLQFPRADLLFSVVTEQTRVDSWNRNLRPYVSDDAPLFIANLPVTECAEAPTLLSPLDQLDSQFEAIMRIEYWPKQGGSNDLSL